MIATPSNIRICSGGSEAKLNSFDPILFSVYPRTQRSGRIISGESRFISCQLKRCRDHTDISFLTCSPYEGVTLGGIPIAHFPHVGA